MSFWACPAKARRYVVPTMESMVHFRMKTLTRKHWLVWRQCAKQTDKMLKMRLEDGVVHYQVSTEAPPSTLRYLWCHSQKCKVEVTVMFLSIWARTAVGSMHACHTRVGRI